MIYIYIYILVISFVIQYFVKLQKVHQYLRVEVCNKAFMYFYKMLCASLADLTAVICSSFYTRPFRLVFGNAQQLFKSTDTFLLTLIITDKISCSIFLSKNPIVCVSYTFPYLDNLSLS